MWIGIITFRILILSQILLLAVALCYSLNSMRVRVAGVALLLAVIGYFAAPLAEVYINPVAGIGFAILGGLVPPLLLVFIWVVFEDHRSVPRSVWVAACVYTLALLWFELTLLLEWRLGLQFAKLGFVAWALVVIWQGRTVDLVEQRFRLRSWLAAGLAVLVVSVVLVELLAGWQVPRLVELLGMALFFVLFFSFNVLFLHDSRRLLLAPTTQGQEAIEQQQPMSSSDPIAQKLVRRMREERLYADHDIRIAGLALLLQLPEYQLRKIINQHMGYRNFNQFVNRYRIAEATERLLTERQLPVLSIALDVGFRSISSFNTAFRNQHGISPTQYRAQRATDS